MIRKLTVLVMSLGAMAALVLPASAAANWKHHTQEIATNVSLGLTGQVWFGHEAWGEIKCQVTTEVQATANTTTGHVKTFLPHPNGASSDCSGTGTFSKCQVKSVQADGLFWLFHTIVIAGQPKVQVTAGEITGTLTGFLCPVKAITLKANANVTMIPDQPETVSWFDSSHNQFQALIQTTDNQTHTVTVQAGGKLDLEDKDGKSQKGTWSI